MDKVIRYCTQYDISRAGMNMTWPLENQELFTAFLVMAALISSILLVCKLIWKKIRWLDVVMASIVFWPLSVGFYHGGIYQPISEYNLLIDKLAHHDFKVIEGKIRAVEVGGRNTEFLVGEVHLQYGDSAPKQGLVDKHLNYQHLEKDQLVRVQYMEGTFLNIFGSSSDPESDYVFGRTITKLETECPK